jgi:alkane 1-monooxygenase
MKEKKDGGNTNNITQTRSCLEPSFLSEVAPYYLPSYVFVVSHIVYQISGNLLIPIWLAYMLNMPNCWQIWNFTKQAAETNLCKESERVFTRDKRFLGPLYVFVLNDCLTWLWCLCLVADVNPLAETDFAFLFERKHGNTLGSWFVFTFVWGYMAGVNGLAGHELIHKKDPVNKMLGMFTYSKILYSHFLLEHSNGHHRNIATPEDSATAVKNEDFYTFAVRSAIGGQRNTYDREVARIESEYKEFNDGANAGLFTYIVQNRMTWFFALHLATLATIYRLLGMRAVFFQLGYSLVGIFFIELINYVEHYGLQRKKDERGIYEPITEQHSWNSTSSHLLFRIQRHSDHHMHAYKPYQILRKMDNAP